MSYNHRGAKYDWLEELIVGSVILLRDGKGGYEKGVILDTGKNFKAVPDDYTQSTKIHHDEDGMLFVSILGKHNPEWVNREQRVTKVDEAGTIGW